MDQSYLPSRKERHQRTQTLVESRQRKKQTAFIDYVINRQELNRLLTQVCKPFLEEKPKPKKELPKTRVERNKRWKLTLPLLLLILFFIGYIVMTTIFIHIRPE